MPVSKFERCSIVVRWNGVVSPIPRIPRSTSDCRVFNAAKNVLAYSLTRMIPEAAYMRSLGQMMENVMFNILHMHVKKPVLIAYRIKESIIESVRVIPVRLRCSATMSTVVDRISDSSARLDAMEAKFENFNVSIGRVDSNLEGDSATQKSTREL